MRWSRLLLSSAAISIALSGCGGMSGLVADHPSGTGPFDSRGNYVEAWADDPSKWNGNSVPKPSEPEPPQLAAIEKPAPTPVAQPRPRPVSLSSSTVTTVSNPKPKPVVKPKPKPKPKATVHTVRKGDTLYGLAKRYGTTVGAIQKGNALKGTVIRIGQTLKIPR